MSYEKSRPGGAGSGDVVSLVLLRRLARQATPLSGPDASAWAPRHERDRPLLDHAQLLADHAALGICMLHHDGALEDSTDTHWLACDHRVEPGGNLVVDGGHDSGERNQFCGSTHSKPPKGSGAATKKRRPLGRRSRC